MDNNGLQNDNNGIRMNNNGIRMITMVYRMDHNGLQWITMVSQQYQNGSQWFAGENGMRRSSVWKKAGCSSGKGLDPLFKMKYHPLW